MTSVDEHLVYLDLGDFARHLIELYKQGTTGEFEATFEAIERLHVHGDSWVQTSVTIGLLESLQNNASHQEVDDEVGPVSEAGISQVVAGIEGLLVGENKIRG